jgi:hypothetical protein
VRYIDNFRALITGHHKLTFVLQKLYGPIFFVLALLYIVLMRNFLKYIEESHHDVWKTLGEPELFANVSVKSANKVLDFLGKRAYAKLEDKALSVRGDILLAILYCLVGSFLILILLNLIKQI